MLDQDDSDVGGVLVFAGGWIPDVRAHEFVAEARRQSVTIAMSERERDDQAFADAISSPWETALEGR